jgi:hypothetical protein
MVVVRIANYPDGGCPDRQLSGWWLSGSSIIRMVIVRISNYPDGGSDRQLSGWWLSGSSIIRMVVVRIANYPDVLGPSGKHFLTVIVLHVYMA